MRRRNKGLLAGVQWLVGGWVGFKVPPGSGLQSRWCLFKDGIKKLLPQFLFLSIPSRPLFRCCFSLFFLFFIFVLLSYSF